MLFGHRRRCLKATAPRPAPGLTPPSSLLAGSPGCCQPVTHNDPFSPRSEARRRAKWPAVAHNQLMMSPRLKDSSLKPDQSGGWRCKTRGTAPGLQLSAAGPGDVLPPRGRENGAPEEHACRRVFKVLPRRLSQVTHMLAHTQQ